MVDMLADHRRLDTERLMVPSPLDDRPTTAGLPLSARTAWGTLASPLHPETHGIFEYSAKRQAYGTVSPRFRPPVAHESIIKDGIKACQDDARKRWYRSFAENRHRESRSTRAQNGLPRVTGSSELLGHMEESHDGWVWQSWRGWTSTSRNLHEQRMRDVWEQEARERWLVQGPRPMTRLEPMEQK
eukprot:TRINITY_DN41352_c0_g1_i1.p1 TRINITY_DN41352_c0_g1~~TRINITY_DN41352_c0_g1_i1.p1  ORF type:complete len:186 (-),score=19.68 TRINITY_DN41352_c0_g1_i1:25-582(-)